MDWRAKILEPGQLNQIHVYGRNGQAQNMTNLISRTPKNVWTEWRHIRNIIWLFHNSTRWKMRKYHLTNKAVDK